jgi:hypothetical protein
VPVDAAPDAVAVVLSPDSILKTVFKLLDRN